VYFGSSNTEKTHSNTATDGSTDATLLIDTTAPNSDYINSSIESAVQTLV